MITPIPVAVQLYTLREEIQGDLPAMLKKLADVGYAGVEFAGFHSHSPVELRKMLDDLGMRACSAHTGLATEENLNEMIEAGEALGYRHHVTSIHPHACEDHERLLKHADEFETSAALLQSKGHRQGVHNHWFEFTNVHGGRNAYEIFTDRAPTPVLEIDTYWVKTGGADPAAEISRYGSRVPLLHIKDGPANNNQEKQVAVGTGAVDWASVFAAVTPATEWLILELDHCETNMFEAVAESYRYIVGEGYGVGLK